MMTTNNEYCSYCQQTSYLPVRSTWARAILNKIESDRCLQNIDRSQWYRLSHSDLLHDKYREYFYEFHEDEETKAFIKQSQEKSDNVPLQMIHSLFISLLTLFITRTSGIVMSNFLFSVGVERTVSLPSLNRPSGSGKLDKTLVISTEK